MNDSAKDSGKAAATGATGATAAAYLSQLIISNNPEFAAFEPLVTGCIMAAFGAVWGIRRRLFG